MAIKSAVVFVHGIFSSPRAWEPLVRLLTEDTDVSGLYEVSGGRDGHGLSGWWRFGFVVVG